MKFAEQLKKLRMEAGLTQAKYSDLTQIPKRSIENWENGQREPPDYVKKFIIEDLKIRKEIEK